MAATDDIVARTFEWLRSQLGTCADVNSRLSEGLAVIEILRASFDDPSLLELAALASAGTGLDLRAVQLQFGSSTALQLESIRKLEQLGESSGRAAGSRVPPQLEALRRMTLALATDIRVVLVRLASRLNELRVQVDAGSQPPANMARETLEVLTPLANRLGLWQLKWELEDLAFRFYLPSAYQRIVAELEQGREQREQFIAQFCEQLRGELRSQQIDAVISGRPKHIYSIYGKMQVKQIPVSRMLDLRAIRVIVADVQACYQCLSLAHRLWNALPNEFDDYIAKPKPNGYQSLHTVVQAQDGKPVEIQIRTQDMHRAAEFGLASHWAYKEASVGVAGSGKRRPNEASQLEWRRQLLAWQAELGSNLNAGEAETDLASKAGGQANAVVDESVRIFCLTPQGRVIELPEHATPVDFAYHVHSDLGHRCRGARVDGHMVPLNTRLRNGQTVEIISANKAHSASGPSRDWLNPNLGYTQSSRTRAKVRQWFSAQQHEQALGSGRERIERALQREGKTALAHDVLAARLGLPGASALFLAAAREEIGPRALEQAIRAEASDPRSPGELEQDSSAHDTARLESSVAGKLTANTKSTSSAQGSVLVVGVDLLLTQLARCCRPIPPDDIAGFVTRGRGISVHRQNCKSLHRLSEIAPERLVSTTWGLAANQLTQATQSAQASRDSTLRARVYGTEIWVAADDRTALSRDILELCVRERCSVTQFSAAQRARNSSQVRFNLQLEVSSLPALEKLMAAIRQVTGVHGVGRR